jgi:outer membrane receptor protein involved in Fe transport
MDPSTYDEGNPDLKPEMSYNVELSHTWKQQFITSLTISDTRDVIIPVLLPSEGNTTIQTVRNVAKMRYYGLSLSYPFRISRRWSNVTNANAYYSRYEGELAGTNIQSGRPAFDLNSSNKIKINSRFQGEAGLNYQSRQLFGPLTMEASWMLNAGLQASLAKIRTVVKLSVSDIFNTGHPGGVSYYSNYNEKWIAHRDYRVVNVQVAYRFGNSGVQPFQRHESGAEEEKSRVKA